MAVPCRLKAIKYSWYLFLIGQSQPQAIFEPEYYVYEKFPKTKSEMKPT
jgi:hypothetical protein